MVINDHSLFQAVNLRVSWDDQDINGMLTQVVRVSTMEEAKDLIIALTMTGNMNPDVMRSMLSNGF